MFDGTAYIDGKHGKDHVMKKQKAKSVEQPKPFTPGVTKGMVRQHAYELYRDKLEHGGLTLEDWVLAEKDLVAEMEKEEA